MQTGILDSGSGSGITKNYNFFSKTINQVTFSKMKKEKIIITIDGPSGVGKGTIAREIAEKMGLSYLDTGSMYRAFALKVINSGVDPDSKKDLEELINSTTIEISDNNIFLDSKEVTGIIRTEKISNMASSLATKSQVRNFLVDLQRNIGKNGNLVAEGRDMGTYVFPDADFKFYLDASTEERAKRRFLQLAKSGDKIDINSLKEDLMKRDKQDMERKESPLHPAVNAVIIDTTDMGKSEVVSKILLHIGGSFR